MRTAQGLRTISSRFLRTLHPFSSLPDDAVRELETKLVLTEHSAGSVLYRQDEKVKGVFLVLQGRVKLSAIVAGERTALLKIASAGGILGLAAALSSRFQPTTAEVLTSSLIGFLRVEEIANATRLYPGFAEALARHLAADCMDTVEETLSLRVPSSSAQRLAAMLLRVAESGKCSRRSDADSTGYTHAELGQLIGASRETVTRILRKFERNGFFLASGPATTDLRPLRELADGSKSRVL